MTKTVLITGASRGIGRAAALQCAERGWSVAINYLSNTAAARETAAAVEAAGGKALLVQADVSREEDVLRMFDEVARHFGPLDGFVNNGGILEKGSRFTEMTTDRLRRVLDINVLGAMICAREAARAMSKSKGGRGGAIVNVSSALSRLGGAGEAIDYATSKGAVDTLTLGLARELGADGIRVNAVRPGVIETDIHAALGEPGRAQRIGAGVPLGRPGRAEEVGATIVWLLEDASSYLSGAIIDVSGGR